jgi:hypothetical protein
MKKVKMMMTLMMCLITVVSFSQWTSKTMESTFDGNFKISYTQINNNGYLFMQEGDVKTDVVYVFKNKQTGDTLIVTQDEHYKNYDSLIKYNTFIEIRQIPNGKKTPFFALRGSYFCDEICYVDFVLFVGGEKKIYQLKALKSSDSKYYYFQDEIWTDEFILNFKSASKCSLRVNQEYCDDDYYEFNMSGSTSAYNFITK